MTVTIQFQNHSLIIEEQAAAPTITLEELKRLLAPAPHTMEQDYIINASLEDVLLILENTHHTVEAAGGVVYNGNEEILMIYRRGFWDLPKGKIDPGETPRLAAIREVQEETGVQDLAIQTELGNSYHTYFMYGGYTLKKTYWYLMSIPASATLVPQTEEDIEEARWVPISELAQILPLAYPNIQYILKHLPPFTV